MSSFPFKTFLAALLASSCFVPVAQAAVVTWDGGAGTMNWQDANNWSGNTLPTSADEVRLNVNGVTASTSPVSTMEVSVGYNGHGTLAIEDGSTLTSVAGHNVFVGTYTGGSGTLTVSGASSTVESGKAVLIGYLGAGALTVEDGGSVSSAVGQDITMGCFAGSTGTITVSGANSTIESAGGVVAGYSGTGTLIVSDGGMVSSSLYSVYAGSATGSTGTITVSGAGSTIQSGKAVFIGYSGTGTMTVFDGGRVTSSLGSAVAAGYLTGSTGTITVSGTGSTIESGKNFYAGNAGTGTLTVSDAGSISVAGVLSIANQSGSTGTLNIGAASGSAAAAAGTVTANSGIAFGAGTGKIVFNHTSNNYTFANNISGSGTIESLAGTTYLTGDLSGFTGTYDLEGGTLSVVTSGVQTLSSSLSGSGTMAFTSGSTYLTGNSSSFTGTSDVSGTGMLSVNGTLGGTVDVASGGRLQGSGTVGAIDAASGGTVAPGNSIGTLNVAGNVSFASGSTYEVEANATSSDKIIATGAATLSGGTVSLIPYQGALLRAGTTYTILTAAGGVSGAFDSVTLALNSLFLTPRLTYDANDVYASIVQSRSFASVAASGNQAHAATTIESLGAGSTLYDAVALQSDVATTQQAFQALDGEIHANVKASVLEDQAAFGRVLSDRLAQASDNSSDTNRAEVKLTAASVPPTSPANKRIPQTSQESAKESPEAARLSPEAARLWAQGFGGWGRREGDANSGNFKHQDKGLMTGVDWMLGDKWRMGLAFGYDRADYDQDDKTGASGTADRYSLSAYGGRSWGKLSLRTGLTYAYSDIDTKRWVSFPYFSDNLKASYGAHSVSGFAETAYAFGDKDSKAEPFANLAYGYVNVPGFTENGGAAALTAKDSGETLGTTTLGARVRQVLPFLDTPKNKAAFQASAGWLHTIGDVSPDSSLRFATGSSFKTQAAPLARDAAVLGAGVDYMIGQQTTLGVAYNGQLGNHADTQAVRGNLSYRF